MLSADYTRGGGVGQMLTKRGEESLGHMPTLSDIMGKSGGSGSQDSSAWPSRARPRVVTRLLKIRHLYGIWSGLIPYRLRLDTLSEYPEP